ncbi:MAG: hypothetical protein HC817_16825, partial [Saprospiraceae bacterium]|nr:hypothetical protein [Saprospiraceae bacterium]
IAHYYDWAKINHFNQFRETLLLLTARAITGEPLMSDSGEAIPESEYEHIFEDDIEKQFLNHAKIETEEVYETEYQKEKGYSDKYVNGLKILKYLIDKGAKIDIKNENGRTAEDMLRHIPIFKDFFDSLK